MALSAKLELRQGQQLVMTPQLQQAIRLLQLSNIELTQFVETELERNPLLETDEGVEAPLRSEMRDGRVRQARGDGAGAARPIARSRQAGRRSRGTFDTDFDNVYPDSAPGGPASGQDASGWASLRQRAPARGDDVNIEAFLANDVSLREHLSAQLPLVLKEPVERLIGQYLIDMVDEAGYLPADLDALPRSSARRSNWSRGARHAADARPARRLRPLARRMPGAAAQGAEPLRPADRRFSTTSICSPTTIFPALRKAVGVDMDELARDDRRDQAAQPEAGPQVRLRANAAGGPRRARARSARRQLDHRAQQRHAAARARQSHLLRDASRSDRLGGRPQLPARMPADRQLAGQEPRPAGAHHPERRRGDRAPAGRLLHARRPVPAPAQSEDGRRRHLDARIDRLARHVQQVHGDAARHLRAEVLLHLRHRLGRRRGNRIPPRPCVIASSR